MCIHMRHDISKTSLFFTNNINIILALLLAYTYNVIFDRLDRVILIINSDTYLLNPFGVFNTVRLPNIKTQ